MTPDRPEGPRVMMVVRLFDPWVGGTERQAEKLAVALVASGVPSEIVTGRWFRGTPRHEVRSGVPVTRNHTLWEGFGVKGLRKFGGYVYMLTLLWFLIRSRRRYDVIHVHGLNYHAFVCVLAGKLLGRPVVVKMANSGPASDILKMRESRQLAGARFLLSFSLRADRFVALNEAVVLELEAAGVESARIVEIPNGVEVGPIDPHRPEAHDGARGILTLLYVGRLHPQKGLDVLLGAVRRLLDEPDVDGGVDVRVRLVGEGPAQADLEALRSRLGLEAHVDFVGVSHEVASHLAAADVFVLPSITEGLSNALLEAMSAGLPCVVSDIPGNRAVVDDDTTGLLFLPGDADALAERLHFLAENPEVAAELGRSARAEIETSFSFSHVVDRYRDLYHDMLEVPSAGRLSPTALIPSRKRI